MTYKLCARVRNRLGIPWDRRFIVDTMRYNRALRWWRWHHARRAELEQIRAQGPANRPRDPSFGLLYIPFIMVLALLCIGELGKLLGWK